MKKVICHGLSEKVQKKVSGLLGKDSEVDLMIANLTQTLREEYKRKRQEGLVEGEARGKIKERIEVVIKLLTKKFGQLSYDVVTKVSMADELQLEAIIDDIFQIQSLDKVIGYLE